MATPIYKVVLYRPSDARYKMSDRERTDLEARFLESLKSVSGERVIMCEWGWSSEQWWEFTLEKYPDVEAAQKYATALFELGWLRYAESVSVLGTEVQGG